MYLGIDIGTSGIKLCVLDEAGAALATVTHPLQVQHPFPGASEQRAEDWWDALLAAMAALLEKPGVDGKAIEGIGLSGQMHGLVLLDGKGGVIHPVILWNDNRSVPQCRQLTSALPNIGEIAGIPPMPGFTAPKLLWVRENQPEVFAKVRHLLLPKDYIGYRLHGGFVTDPSDAAGTMLLDEANCRWSDDICAAAGLDRSWLPELRSGTEIAGHLTEDAASILGLKPGIPIAAGGGDAAAGAVGIGAIHPGDSFVSLGTSGQFFVTNERYQPAPEKCIHAFAHTLPGLWFSMAALLNGARPIAWFAGVAGQPIGTLLEQAERTPMESAPLFLPYLTGERTPHGDPDAQGGFYGLTDSTGAAEMMRGVVHAIAYSFRDSVDAIKEAGTPFGNPLAIGGGTASAFVLQTLADVLELPITKTAGSEVGPALGAGRLAMVASGHCDLETAAPRPAVETVFEPKPRPHLQAQYARFRQLYRATRNL